MLKVSKKDTKTTTNERFKRTYYFQQNMINNLCLPWKNKRNRPNEYLFKNLASSLTFKLIFKFLTLPLQVLGMAYNFTFPDPPMRYKNLHGLELGT